MHKKIKEKLEKLAEEQEREFDEISVLFESAKLGVSELDPTLDGFKLEARALNSLKSHFNNQKFNAGRDYYYVPFGVAIPAKDQNEKLRTEILNEWGDPTKRIAMIQAGKLMTMKDETSGEAKPVREIKKMTKINDEWVVTDGIFIQNGDTPIARDYIKVNKYADGNEYPNQSFSRPLFSNWKITLFGLGFFAGIKKVGDKEIKATPLNDGIYSRVQVFGKWANPNDPSFVCKKTIWFKPCRFKATEGTKSFELSARVNCKSEFQLSNKILDIEKLSKAINSRVSSLSKKFMALSRKLKTEATKEKDEAKLKKGEEALAKAKEYKVYESEDYIPFIDLNDIRDYHLKYSAVYKDVVDEEGETVQIIAKNKDGYDITDWNAFALAECVFNGIYESEGKSPKMILDDWSLDNNLFVSFSKELQTNIPPSSSVIISLTTSRGNKVWDADSESLVVDPENAKVFPLVRGIRSIMNFSEVNIDQALQGDMS